MSSSLLTTPRIITEAGKFLCMAIGTSSDILRINRSVCGSFYGSRQSFFHGRKTVFLVPLDILAC